MYPSFRLSDIALSTLFAAIPYLLYRRFYKSTVSYHAQEENQKLVAIESETTSESSETSTQSEDRGEQAKATGIPLFIELHPQDNGRDLHRTIFQHPDSFIPERDSDDGHIRYWGINPPDDEDQFHAEVQRKFQRRAVAQALYGGIGPEHLFVRALIERKVQALEQMPLGDLERSDYVLKISLRSEHINPKEDDFNIWRRVRVSGGLSLSILAEKVITPVMGWAPNYHAHFFNDYKDGSMFGPQDCTPHDAAQLVWLGYEYIPEARWKVAHLLSRPGDIIAWRYDFKDNWEHTIEVMSIIPPEESSGKVVVIDGSGACPAEDCSGVSGWCDMLQHLRTGTPEQKQEALTKIVESMNYVARGVTLDGNGSFDPDHFNLEEATAAVKDALSLPGALQLDVRQVNTSHVPNGFVVGDLDQRWKKKKQHSMKVGLPNGAFLESSSRRNSMSSRACSNCGTPHRLSLDTRCRAVYYCGSECQLAHWAARHKRECKRLAKEGFGTQGASSN